MTALVRSTASLLLNMVKCRFVHQKGLLSMKHIKMILSLWFLSDQFRSNNNIEQMNISHVKIGKETLFKTVKGVSF